MLTLSQCKGSEWRCTWLSLYFSHVSGSASASITKSPRPGACTTELHFPIVSEARNQDRGANSFAFSRSLCLVEGLFLGASSHNLSSVISHIPGVSPSVQIFFLEHRSDLVTNDSLSFNFITIFNVLLLSVCVTLWSPENLMYLGELGKPLSPY